MGNTENIYYAKTYVAEEKDRMQFTLLVHFTIVTSKHSRCFVFEGQVAILHKRENCGQRNWMINYFLLHYGRMENLS